MYFDEDGDLAHEFYEEVPPKKAWPNTMRPISLEELNDAVTPYEA